MSRTSVAINEMKKDLDRISGLTGEVSDFVEIMRHDLHKRIEDILNYVRQGDDNDK